MLTYTISTAFVSKLMVRFPRRLFILLSFVMLSFATLLQGPSSLLHLPDSNMVMMLGFAISGIAQGFVFIPLLPEAIESIYIKESLVEGQSEHQDQLLNDMASGLYSTFYSVGQILAPTIGGALYDSIGYKSTCDLMSLLCLVFSTIYFMFNVGTMIFAEESKIKLKMEKLKARYHEREAMK
jgi:MFS family permease